MSNKAHRWTYTDLVEGEYGWWGVLSLKLAIVVNNAGSMVRSGAGAGQCGGAAVRWVHGVVAGMGAVSEGVGR